ncbi:MAG: HU family DNA-binding protein [Fibromonadaceae bacterium]|nr:HU family DNA-binding protein [Fibromonadaceae bacterium]
MPITKNDLINDTAISCGAQRHVIKMVIEQFFNVVQDSAKEGRSLELRGFGTFYPKSYNPRAGRNLKTGELIPLAASKSMSLKFSAELKAKIAGSVIKQKQEAASKLVLAHELAKTNSL